MAGSIYITALGPESGKSIVSLGVVEMLTARLGRVGYFRPIVPSSSQPDPQIELIRSRFGLTTSYDEMQALTMDEAAEMIGAGQHGEIARRVIEAYKPLERSFDMVVCEGTDYIGGTAVLDFDLNADLANELGASVLAVVRGGTVPEVTSGVSMARDSLARKNCSIFGVIVNRVPPMLLDESAMALMRQDSSEPVYVLPEHLDLANPTVAEVSAALKASLVSDAHETLHREVRGVRVAAMGVEHFMEGLTDDTLVIVPGDRADILVASLASALTPGFPAIAGVVLTGGYELDGAVRRLVEGAPFPVLDTSLATYEATTATAGVKPALTAGDERRIATALGVFEAGADPTELGNRIHVERAARKTPSMFEYELIERAKAIPRHVVLPEGDDERVLRAAEILLRRGVADLTILGDPNDVRSRAAALGLDVAAAEVVDPATSPLRDDFAARYHEIRKHRGMTEELAYETVADVSYFGTLMVHAGAADGMVSGAAHTTGDTIRPAFEIIKSRKGVSVISSVFFMCLPDRVLVYGDCAVNPKPDAKQLADIAISSAETASSFGIDPRVAMLSYSTGESARGPDVTMVREATGHAQERRPDLRIEGPLQYDAAVDASVAKLKMPGSEVAGQATVLIFPDLDTGNVAYKAVQRSSGALAIGPVLQGLNKPVNDLSRGTTVPDIVNTVAITAIQAQDDIAARAARGRSIVLEHLRVPRGASIAGVPAAAASPPARAGAPVPAR